MKKKLTAVLLCATLLLTLSVNTSANSLDSIPDSVEQIANSEATAELISQDENASVASATTGIVSGAVYRIKNVGSGKYMNVHNGVDANGTNIYQWTSDGSTEQKFRVVYFANSDSYLIYAMCSSNGNNRVVDVTRGSSPLTHGQNIKLYNPTDPTSQQLKIISTGQNQYRIAMKNNTTLGLAACGTSNGSASGTSATSAGNIFISTYTGATNQQWQFELLQNPPNPEGSLDSVTASTIGGWAYQTGEPDTPIWVHIYITNNSTSEQTLLSKLASNYRSDLEAAGYGDGEHAFHHAMNWYDYPAGTYTVSAYAIGSQGVNPQISNSPKTFTVRNMTGVVDHLNSSGISGWAWKPDAPDNTVAVHVYVRNSDNQTVGFYNTQASNYRSDLENAGYGDGEHGFSISIDWSTLPEENLRVTAYAVDGTGIHPAFYDGYYNNGSGTTINSSYIWPTVSKRITQNFKSGTHYGLDIGAVTAGVAGDPVYCFADGYVIRSEWSSSYGYVVYVNHTNPKPSISPYIQTKYAHMSENLLVSNNTNITKGTQVGYMNTTGQSNGVHLHFETVMVSSMTTLEMWANGKIDKSKCIDPLNYFDSSGNVLAYNINSNDNSWGLTFDINKIEIDIYDRFNHIMVE